MGAVNSWWEGPGGRPTAARRSSTSAAGVAGRGFAQAPGLTPLASAMAVSSRPPERRNREDGRTRPAGPALRRARSVISVPIASPKRAIASARDGLVEAERLGKRERVHRSVRQPVAPADRLGQRVTQPEARRREGRAGVHRSFEELSPRLEVVRMLDNVREPLRDEGGAGERLLVALGISALDVPPALRRARGRSSRCQPSPLSAVRPRASGGRRSPAQVAPSRNRCAAFDRGRAPRSSVSTRRPSTSSETGRPGGRSRPRSPSRGRWRSRLRRRGARPRLPSPGPLRRSRSEGTSDQRPTTSTGGSQSRARDEERPFSLPSSSSSPGSSARPQRTFTLVPARTRRTRRRRGSPHAPAAPGRARSARRLEPADLSHRRREC